MKVASHFTPTAQDSQSQDHQSQFRQLQNNQSKGNQMPDNNQIVTLSTIESNQIMGGTLAFPPRENTRENTRDHIKQRSPQIAQSAAQQALPKAIQTATQTATWKGLPKTDQKADQKADWSDSIQAVLEHPPASLPRYLIGLGLIFSSIFVGWACFGQMQEVSRAQGQLVPQGETYKVQPVLQGKVDSILVEEGDFVQAGDILLTLDANRLSNEVTRLEQSIAATQAEQAQVRSLILKTQQESEAQSQIATANIQTELAVLEQTESAIDTHKALLSSLQSEMASHEERFNRISTLESAGAISKEYLFSIEQGVRDQQQAIVQNQGQLEESLAQKNQSQARISQKQAEREQIENQAQQTLQKLRIEEQQLQATIADTSTQLDQAKSDLEQSYVSAPTAGLISNLAINNTGEVVEPGQDLAEIVPEDMPLTLSAIVPHQEAGLLHVGMETQIKLDAFPYQNYGILSGKIESISPDAKLPDSREGETTSGYQVNVSLDKDFVMHEQQKVKLQVGQTASAEIVIRRRRIIEIVLDPIRQLKESNLSL